MKLVSGKELFDAFVGIDRGFREIEKIMSDGYEEVLFIERLLKSRLKAARRVARRKPNAITYQDKCIREWQMVRAIANIKSGLFGRKKRPTSKP